LLGTQAGVEDPEKKATFEAVFDEWDREGLNDQLAETIAATILGNEWPGREPWIAKWRRMPQSQLRRAFQALVGREDIHDRLREMTAPALVIHGTADRAIEMEEAQRLSAELVNSQPLIAIDGGSHASNITDPEPVNLALEKFLGELGFRTRRAVGRQAVERRAAERRAVSRRSHGERRFGERREPARAAAGRRSHAASDRRLAERRVIERRQTWPVSGRT
ncbi:MAG: alpha/beta hydrolase, partial [Candidatus Dormibacteraeota bacterium]|nr:alpha/beta hydrolase [Candidatus Dormibacteraeota bacterium]